MGKPVAGEIVVLPFPQTNLQSGKRRPALVVVDLPGDDLILCQITSQARRDRYSILLDAGDFESGQLKVSSFIRPPEIRTIPGLEPAEQEFWQQLVWHMVGVGPTIVWLIERVFRRVIVNGQPRPEPALSS